MFILYELRETLADAWRAADLVGRLKAWWWVATHRDLLDAPTPSGAEVTK